MPQQLGVTKKNEIASPYIFRTEWSSKAPTFTTAPTESFPEHPAQRRRLCCWLWCVSPHYLCFHGSINYYLNNSFDNRVWTLGGSSAKYFWSVYSLHFFETVILIPANLARKIASVHSLGWKISVPLYSNGMPRNATRRSYRSMCSGLDRTTTEL